MLRNLAWMPKPCLQTSALLSQLHGWRPVRTQRDAEPARVAHVNAGGSQKKRVVFLGSPEVAQVPLRHLLVEAAKTDAGFEVSAVVTQPPRKRGRSAKSVQPSPVHQQAIDSGLESDQILTPVTAKEEAFLQRLEALQPDLCVTAAYGNMLSQRFLDIPKQGTLNIHPSLLPLYRGAAPVNRCLENGDTKTGVSLAFTVLKCDAGPVLAQQEYQLDGSEQTPQLLQTLFELGSELLIKQLPAVLSGEAASRAQPQDEDAASHAAKMRKEDGQLDLFSSTAQELHNKVRGFAGWPGTTVQVRAVSEAGYKEEAALKILRTRYPCQTCPGATGSNSEAVPLDTAHLQPGEVLLSKHALCFPCGDGSWLEVLEVQMPNRRANDAQAFCNGMAGSRLFVQQPTFM